MVHRNCSHMALNAKTLGTLQKLGLKSYEAKAYTALTALGPTTATVLSAEAAVPRTKIYEALRRLEEEHWITVSKGRPSTYIPRYPREVVEQRRSLFCSEVDELSDALTVLYDRRIENEELDALLIRGIDSITAKMLEMVDRARRSVMIMGSFATPDEINKLNKKIKRAKAKDVTARVIASPLFGRTHLEGWPLDFVEAFQPIKNDVRVFAPHLGQPGELEERFGDPFGGRLGFARLIIIDRREMMLTIAKTAEGVLDLEGAIAIWISNAAIVQFLTDPSIFDAKWEVSKPIT